MPVKRSLSLRRASPGERVPSPKPSCMAWGESGYPQFCFPSRFVHVVCPSAVRDVSMNRYLSGEMLQVGAARCSTPPADLSPPSVTDRGLADECIAEHLCFHLVFVGDFFRAHTPAPIDRSQDL